MARKDRVHVLPERLRPGLDLVFCGTAPGRKSALTRTYYAHPQNKFWRTLHTVGLTPGLIAPHDYQAVDGLGTGPTDTAKSAYGMDHQSPRLSLGPKAARDLRRRIAAI